MSHEEKPRLNDQHRKQLQRMITDPQWGAFEAFFNNFMLTHFATASIKRQTEFDTMWYAAEHEGAKRMLVQFMNELEQEAGKVEID